ncbi:hypothetical protein MTO96_034770 [Rhipicephalus appendiculatus]
MRAPLIRPSLAQHTAALFCLVVTATISDGSWWPKIKYTCPTLDHCACDAGSYAVFIHCNNIASARDLEEDMAKLVGIRQKKLNFIKDIEEVVCEESRDTLVARKAFVSLSEADLCPEMISRATTYLLTVLGFLAATLALLSTYLCYKHNVKTWLNGRGLACLTRCITEDEQDEEKLFDVFVSFSSKDQVFVHDNILPILEAHGFSYCTYERNFKGGFLLQDIIRDAIACSRRTLLVLTQNFLMSEWCRWEFRVAHQRALQDNVNRLIIVLVDEFAPGMLNDDLRQYVRETNYLRWNETNFWERLLHSMPRKNVTRKTISEHSPV